MGSEKFRRDVQKRAAARAKQTQNVSSVKEKAPAQKIPVWQGCLALLLVVLVVGGTLFSLVYKTQIEPVFREVQLTVTTSLATATVEFLLIEVESSCFVQTSLTKPRCEEKARAAWQEDPATVRSCINISSVYRDGGRHLMQCLAERGLWD
jgi:hypothetical protein